MTTESTMNPAELTAWTDAHRDLRSTKDRTCSVCGVSITRYAKSGKCALHAHQQKYAHTPNDKQKLQHHINRNRKWKSPNFLPATPLDGCVHHRVLGPQVAGRVTGVCRECGDVKVYDVWAAEDAPRLSRGGKTGVNL